MTGFQKESALELSTRFNVYPIPLPVRVADIMGSVVEIGLVTLGQSASIRGSCYRTIGGHEGPSGVSCAPSRAASNLLYGCHKSRGTADSEDSPKKCGGSGGIHHLFSAESTFPPTFRGCAISPDNRCGQKPSAVTMDGFPRVLDETPVWFAQK